MKLPNFFMVGVGRAGSTSLYFYLKEHPEVYMCPIKEPHYFADKNRLREHIDSDLSDIISSWEKYIDLFKNVTSEKAVGESSTGYLHYAEPRIIESKIAEAKIIINLRNPIERAYSHYLMDVSGTLINPYEVSFIDAIKKIPMFTRLGFYHDRVKRYIEVFGRSKVKIILYDDLKQYAEETVKSIYAFLEVDTAFSPNVKIKYNTSFSVPRNRIAFLVHSTELLKKPVKDLLPETIMDKLRKLSRRVLLNSSSKPEIGEEAKGFLQNVYSDDIHRLEDLIGRDVSRWLG